MGDYARGERSRRFIEEFGAEILKKFDMQSSAITGKPTLDYWELTGHVHIFVEIADGKKEPYALMTPEQYFNPETPFTEDEAKNTAEYLELPLEGVLERFKKRDLL